METKRDHGVSEDPSLDGPDYLSLVIEWEGEQHSTAAPGDDMDEDTHKIRDWDIVDEASMESFPASDPPGYYSSHAAPSRSTARVVPTMTYEPRHLVRKILMAVAAVGALFALVQRLRHRHT